MKYAVALLLLGSFWRVSAQTFSQEVWYDGKVVLDTEDTLTGSVRFDLASNLLEVGAGGVVKAFSARKVASFEIYDAVHQQTRYFYTLPYNSVSDYKVPTFFELITQGQLSLLCREALVTETVPMYGGYGSYSYGGLGGFGRPGNYITRTRIADEFYFGYTNGNIRRFMGNKKDFYSLVRNHEKEVKEFIEERKLHFDERSDLAKIVEYYNYLEGK